MTRALGARNGRAKGTFIGDTRQQVIDFYAEVVQNLSSWQAKAPKLPPPPDVVPDEPQSEPPPFVAASEREVGEGRLNGDESPDDESPDDESPDDESPPSALPWAARPAGRRTTRTRICRPSDGGLDCLHVMARGARRR